MSRQTNRGVFPWKKSPINSKPCSRVMFIFQFQTRQVALNQPLVPFSPGKTFFRKCWVMFGQRVCWLCTLGPTLLCWRPEVSQAGLLKVTTGPQNTDNTTPGLLPRWYTESGQHVGLWCAAAEPGSLQPQTRVNKHNQLHKHFGCSWESPRTARY